MKISEIAALLKVEYRGDDVEFEGAAIDSRQVEENNLFIALPGRQVDGNTFVSAAKAAGASAAIVTAYQACELPQILVKDSQKALRQLAADYRQKFHLPVVAITGSCGKTTAKNMLASIFREASSTLANKGTYNNELGVSWMLMGLRKYHEYAVFELGANHKGEIADLVKLVKPCCAAVTMVAPVHLEGFGHVDDIAQAKSEIYEGLPSDGIAIINADDEYCDYFIKKAGNRRKIFFGKEKKADVIVTDIVLSQQLQPQFVLHTPEASIPVNMQLVGEHNVMNALVAAACAYAFGITLAQIKKGIEACKPEIKRLIVHQSKRGTVVIDDSYNANPSSVAAAVKLLAKYSGKKILVLGDMLELGDRAVEMHRHIGRLAKEHQVNLFYGYGELSKEACLQFGENGFHFSDQNTLIANLTHQIDAQTTLLVKGSNSMKMWNVVEAILGESSCCTG
ncbi:MAG: hypothetical protein A3F17_00625 [Gammaproteobacteria bacterium RIFCSPHIGHO2_12_FULL_41_15]|nr:MAG: hypothetical protein A3F17_00625 [Gammaproteobacteria bacterium RIFCSPHIGHO2_12_FULL_41_15]